MKTPLTRFKWVCSDYDVATVHYCEQCGLARTGSTFGHLCDRDESVEQYRARVVEEACNMLSAAARVGCSFDFVDGHWSRDAHSLAREAIDADTRNDWKREHIYAEAEALLRCGWRPESWGGVSPDYIAKDKAAIYRAVAIAGGQS